MTLLLPMINRDQAILLSDRRVTGASLGVRSEEWTKSLTFHTDDGRVGVALAGLAQAGRFDTGRWLMEALLECGEPDHRLLPTITRLGDKATKDLRRLRLSAVDMRLTIIFAGYLYSEEPPRCCFHVLTNFDAPGHAPRAVASDNFELHSFYDRRPADREPVLVMAFGGEGLVTEQDVSTIMTFLRERRPPTASIGKGIEIIRRAADNPASAGRIGKQISSIVVPADSQAPAAVDYHTAVIADRAHLPSQVISRSDVSMAIGTPQFGSLDSIDPQAPFERLALTPFGPKLSRNQRCWCGSGKKYKRCHGV